MKKIIFSILIVLSIILSFGCSKKEEQKEIESKTINKETTKSDEIDLYSDDKKIVFSNGQTKLVYYYEKEKITGYVAYMDYETKELAEIAKNTIEQDSSIKKISTKGRYVIVEYNESEYNTMTLSKVKLVNSHLKEVQKN